MHLRRIQIVHSLSDLDMLEVINAGGAALLKESLRDQSETGIIPKIPASPAQPKMRRIFPKPVGNNTVDVAEARDKYEGFMQEQDRLGIHE